MNKNLIFLYGILFLSMACSDRHLQEDYSLSEDSRTELFTGNVEVGGILGEAIDINRKGRVKHFIKDEQSEAIKIFDREVVVLANEPNWRGEHAGKWLYTASRSAFQSNDQEIKQSILDVADYLISQQEPDGYLGTYGQEIRMTQNSGKNIKSWDIWVHGYLMEGFIEIYKLFENNKYLVPAASIGNLCLKTFGPGEKSLANISYHTGMVGTGIIGPFVELYRETDDFRYLDFARYCVEEMENRPGLELVTRARGGFDVSLIGNGKIYEMMRVFTGLAKLYQVDPDEKYLEACVNAWNNIEKIHLSPTGGPWGGIDKHLECFNREFVFSPYGYNETCATMDWYRFTAQMLQITGEARYAEMLERVAYNAILGAQFPDGEHWVYHSLANGMRRMTGEWACCSSSGTLVLEEIPVSIFGLRDGGISVNIYTPAQAGISLDLNNLVTIKQFTEYPFDDKIIIKLQMEKPLKFPLFVRIPEWAENPEVMINTEPEPEDITSEIFYRIDRKWEDGDQVELKFPMTWRKQTRALAYNEEGWYLDMEKEYSSISKGPLVYACEWKDDIKEPSELYAKDIDLLEVIKPVLSDEGNVVPGFYLEATGFDSLTFLPYYAVGDRADQIYKTTWIRTK